MSSMFLLDGVPQGARVVVAMSGGVDSSVVAGLLHEAGYEVIGITLQLYDQGAALMRKGSCCAGQDIYDAKQVAGHLGIPHYVLNYESLFRQEVVDSFVESYLQGQTPIPCVQCNQKVKFKDLLQAAQQLDACALATGHYVRRVVVDGKAQLWRGVDPMKDQSYFLFGTTQEQLNYVHFPLGGLCKTVTRSHAQRLGLPVHEKPDSQDICFVPDGDYVAVIKKARPEACLPGDIVHIDGRILGKHQGIVHYTVGQRKGLFLGGQSEPLFVIKIDACNNRVIVGPKQALARTRIEVRDINWLGNSAPSSNLPITLKIRSARPVIEGTLTYLPESSFAYVTLISPEYGVSPGQACVFYHQEQVLGGGWIFASACANPS